MNSKQTAAARAQVDAAEMEAINDDARVHSFTWISLHRTPEGYALFGDINGHPMFEPGRTDAGATEHKAYLNALAA